jgi:hypothetical protein
MSTFMVVCSFRPDVAWEEVSAMVPQEQEAATLLREEGALLAVRVSVARDKVFLEVSAEDRVGALGVAQRLPMSVVWDLEAYEIAVPA